MSDNEHFAKIMVALQGVTVLEAPRVSRETIIHVLREHTGFIKSIKQELSSISTVVQTLVKESSENKRVIQMMARDIKDLRTSVEDVGSQITSLRGEVVEIGDKVQQLMTLKQIVKDQGNQLSELIRNYEAHKEEMQEYMHKATLETAAVDAKVQNNYQEFVTLKDYVDHFGENLVLSSTQITVESHAGFAERPMSLLEILKKCHTFFDGLEEVTKAHDEKITANTTAIDTKADEAVLFDVDNLNTKVKAIEVHLKREEAQGISAIRKQCDNLSEEVQLIQSAVADKVDKVVVESIVHRKYDDIVQYLQDALQSTAEDENNFKKKAEDLEQVVTKMNAAKADRTEVTPLQEMLVRTEAALAKLASNRSAASKDTYTRKEVEAMMELKMDKTEFEKAMEVVNKGVKKKQKLATLSGGVPPADDTLFGKDNSFFGRLEPRDALKEEATAKQQAMQQAQQQQQQQQLLASKPALLAERSISPSGGKESDFSAYMRSNKKAHGNRASSAMQFAVGSEPGAFRVATEGGIPGGQANLLTSHSTSSLPEMKSVADYPLVPPDSGAGGKPGSPLSFIGGPFVGGGFNSRAGQIRTQALKPMGVVSGDVTDLEGAGLMVKGKDGRYYYTDNDSEADFKPTANVKALPQQQQQHQHRRHHHSGLSDEIE